MRPLLAIRPRVISARLDVVLSQSTASCARLLTGTHRGGRVAAILLLVTFAACEGDTGASAGPIARSVDGTYTLQLYNTFPLPNVSWAGTTKHELVSGSLILHPDDTYSNQMLVKVTEPDGSVRTVDQGVSGTFSVREQYRGNGTVVTGAYGYDTTVTMNPVSLCCAGVLRIGVVRGREITVAQGMPAIAVFTK
jgi:hypothetical protein